MTAKGEEVIVDTNARQRQGFFHGLADTLLKFVSGSRMRHISNRYCSQRRRQQRTIYLAIRQQWNAVETDKMLRDHVIRQGRAQVCAQGCVINPGDARGLRGQIGHKALVTRAILANHGDNLGDIRVTREVAFNFAQLDAKAAQLDLMIETAQMFELAIVAPATAVTGTVDKSPCRV